MKRRMFKKFSFRGVDLDALLDMPTEELVKLFHALAQRWAIMIRFGPSADVDYSLELSRIKYVRHNVRDAVVKVPMSGHWELHGYGNDFSHNGGGEEEEEVPVSFQKRKHKDSVRTTKEEGKHLQAADVSSSYEKEESSKCVDVDNGNWQAFQNFLLSKDEDDTDRDMFPLHNDVQMRMQDNGKRIL
ncbi:40S ribosomal protein S15 [Nymphaea thermarum]|nr:40S ribosomal protein S15 [Nymphaea thermarum]